MLLFMDDSHSESLRRKIEGAYPGAKVLLVIPVLWDGWELDTRAAVIRPNPDGPAVCITTDHGALTEQPVAWLYEKRREYGQAIRSTLDAVRLLL